MSQPCATPECERISRGLCDCCKQNLCLQHLGAHNALLVSQLNPLTDQINILNDRLKSFNIESATKDRHQKLEEWRKECHEKIDKLFKEKSQEFDRLVIDSLDRQEKEVQLVQTKLAKHVREQEITRQGIDFLTSTIQQLENEIKRIEDSNIQIITHSLQLDDDLVQIQEINKYELELSSLSPVYRTLPSPAASYVVLANNEQFLLTHQKPNLCLIGKEMTVTKKVPWKYSNIWDMCWSPSLNRFVVVEENDIYLVDDKTMSIENLETIGKRRWLSCTCSDTSLFLSANTQGSSIMKLKLSPTIDIIKEWKTPFTCAKDERIDGMAYQNNTCAIVISNSSQKLVRIELRSCETLDRIWSRPLDITVNQALVFRCCSLTSNEWLMIDYETKRLLHITKDGNAKKIISYNEVPRRARLFASDVLVVSTNMGINLHKIKYDITTTS